MPLVIVRASSAAVEVLEEAIRRFVGVASGVAAFVQSPGTSAFIAVDGHEVQGWCWGYVLARPDGASMLYLHNLEVAESCRGRGIGRSGGRAQLANLRRSLALAARMTRRSLSVGKKKAGVTE